MSIIKLKVHVLPSFPIQSFPSDRRSKQSWLAFYLGLCLRVWLLSIWVGQQKFLLLSNVWGLRHSSSSASHQNFLLLFLHTSSVLSVWTPPAWIEGVTEVEWEGPAVLRFPVKERGSHVSNLERPGGESGQGWDGELDSEEEEGPVISQCLTGNCDL